MKQVILCFLAVCLISISLTHCSLTRKLGGKISSNPSQGDGYHHKTAIYTDYLGQIIALNDGSLVFVDDSKIRMINGTTNIISTLLGTEYHQTSPDGNASGMSINKPHGLAVNSKGEVHFCESDSFVIRKIDLSTMYVTTIVGNLSQQFDNSTDSMNTSTSLASAKIHYCKGIAFGLSDDILYFTEYYMHFLRMVNLTDGTVKIHVGTGGTDGDFGASLGNPSFFIEKRAYSLPYPVSVSVSPNSGNIFIACDDRVVGVYEGYKVFFIAGKNPSVPDTGSDFPNSHPSNTRFLNITSVFTDGSSIFFTESGRCRVLELDSGGNWKQSLGSATINACTRNEYGLGVPRPQGVVSVGGKIYVTSEKIFELKTSAPMQLSKSVFSGSALIEESHSFPVSEMNLMDATSYFQINSKEYLIGFSKSIYKVSNGIVSLVAGEYFSKNFFTINGLEERRTVEYNSVNGIQDLFVNSAGDVWFISKFYDYDSAREFATFSHVVGTHAQHQDITEGHKDDAFSQLQPYQFKANPTRFVMKGSTIYFTESPYSYIRKYNFDTIELTSIAGNGTMGYYGDGGNALNAMVNDPYGISLTNNGEIIFADRGNHLIRKIDLLGTITTIAGTGISTYNGDGLPALQTNIDSPEELKIGSNQDIYFTSKYGNSKVVRVLSASTNNITTVAGSGSVNTISTLIEGATVTKDTVLSFDKIAIAGSDIFGLENIIYDSETNTSVVRWVSSRYLCYGSYNDTCGHGTCVDTDVCGCDYGWQGTQCNSLLTCNSVLYNSSSVCSGHGTCKSPDVCECNNGYYGPNCDVVKCFGVFSNDSSVCSSKGNCTFTDTCVCNQYWHAEQCQYYRCNGIYSNESSVCNYHNGTCANDTCTCNNGWYGSSCATPKCFSFLATDTPNVCSGHGSCILPDTCACSNYPYGGKYSGANCSLFISSTDPKSRTVGGSTSYPFKEGMSMEAYIFTDAKKPIISFKSGNSFIFYDNFRIIRSTNGKLSVLMGNGIYQPSDDTTNHGSTISIEPVNGFALDNNEEYLYFSEPSRIRKVSLSSGNVTTVAGIKSQTLVFGTQSQGPALSTAIGLTTKLAVGIDNTVYFTDQQFHVVKKVENGTISIIAGVEGGNGFTSGGGPALSTSISYPDGIYVDKSTGKIYFTTAGFSYSNVWELDSGNLVRLVGTSGQGSSGLNGQAVNAALKKPTDIFVYRSEVYVLDSGNCRIVKVDSNGDLVLVAGLEQCPASSDSTTVFKTQAVATQFYLPQPPYMSFTNGSIYVTAEMVYKVDLDSNTISAHCGMGVYTESDQIDKEHAMFKGQYLSSALMLMISKNDYYISINGKLIRVLNGVVSTVFGYDTYPSYFPIGPSSFAKRMESIPFSGTLSTQLFPTSLASSFLTKDRILYFFLGRGSGSDFYLQSLDLNTRTISTLTNWTSTTTSEGGLAKDTKVPAGQITLDSNNNIYISDYQNNKIRKIDSATGILSLFAGTGAAANSPDESVAASSSIQNPGAMKVDPLTGDLYFIEKTFISNNIRKIRAVDGKLQTVVNSVSGATNFLLTPSDIYILFSSSFSMKRYSFGVVYPFAGDGTNPDSSNGYAYVAHDTEIDSKLLKLSAPRTFEIFGSKMYALLPYRDSDYYFFVREFDPYFSSCNATCLNGGECSSPTTCSCLTGFYGSSCENIVTCFGKQFNQSNVCSGHGSCTTMDTCSCTSGWFGSSCDQRKCFDILSGNSSVCSGNGKCNNTDTCICNVGFSGTNCSEKVDTTLKPQTKVIAGALTNNVIENSSKESLSFDNIKSTKTLSSGEVIVSDNSRIIKVHNNGSVSTLVGTGVSQESDDANQASSASILTARGIAIDNGENNLYFCEDNRIRKVSLSNGSISTVAGVKGQRLSSQDSGEGSASSTLINGCSGVAVGAQGEVYFTEKDIHQVKKIENGQVSVIAGNKNSTYSANPSSALNSSIPYPDAITVSPQGKVYVTSSNDNINVVYEIYSGTINRVAGSDQSGHSGLGSSATSAKLSEPSDVLYHNSELYILEKSNCRVVKVDGSGNLIKVAGLDSCPLSSDDSTIFTEGGSSQASYIAKPSSMSLVNGKLYISSDKIYQVDLNSNTISSFAGQGIISDEDQYSSQDVVLARDSSLFVISQSEYYINTDGKLLHFNDGKVTTLIGQNSYSSFYNVKRKASPFPVSGTISRYIFIEISIKFITKYRVMYFFGNTADKYLHSLDLDTLEIQTHANSSTVQEGHVFVDDDRNIYVSQSSSNKIVKIEAETDTVTKIAGSGNSGNSADGNLAINSDLNNPKDLFVSSNGDVSFSDSGNKAIKKIKSSDGKIETIANISIAADTLSVSSVGDIYAGSNSSNKIVRITGGIEYPYAGTGEAPNNQDLENDYENEKDSTKTKITANNFKATGGQVISLVSGTSISVVRSFSAFFVCNITCGNGECSSNTTCECNKGWTGSSCNSIITCYGKQYNDSNVCGGQLHGQCDGVNTCKCKTGYYGSNCDLVKCNGILSNATGTVCSGHGSCIATNNCTCQANWTGIYCSNYIGANSTNSSTTTNSTNSGNNSTSNNTTIPCTLNCVNGGHCVNNTCQCPSVFYGALCEKIRTCFGVQYNNSQVCNGKGNCVDVDKCSCPNANWVGPKCNVTFCSNFRADDVNVCSGKGTCSNTDVCVCISGYEGSNCEKKKIIKSNSEVQGGSLTNKPKDGEKAEAVTFDNQVQNVAILPKSGSLIVADDTKIIIINPNNTVTTVAGTGNKQTTPDTVNPTVPVSVNQPKGLAVDEEEEYVYFCEEGSNTIRKISLKNGTLTTVAGVLDQEKSSNDPDSGSATSTKIGKCKGVALGNNQEVYFTEPESNKVKKIENDQISVVAGNGNSGYVSSGNAQSSPISKPSGIEVSKKTGDVYVTSEESNSVFKISSGNLQAIAGRNSSGSSGVNGPATQAELKSPKDLSISGDDVYISDEKNCRVVKINGSGDLVHVAGLPNCPTSKNQNGTELKENAKADNFYIPKPQTIAVKNDTLYIASDYVYSVNLTSGDISVKAGKGKVDKSDKIESKDIVIEGSDPQFFAVSQKEYYVATEGQIIRFLDDNVETLYGSKQSSTFYSNSDGDYERRKENSKDGTISKDSVISPKKLFVKDEEVFFFENNGENDNTEDYKLKKIDIKTDTLTTLTKGSGNSGDKGSSVDAKVNIGELFVNKDKEVLISQTDDNVIRKIFKNGTIDTICGTGIRGDSEDGTDASQARIDGPTHIHEKNNGDIVFVDSGNNKIRSISNTTNKISTIISNLTATVDSMTISSVGEIFIGYNYTIYKINNGTLEALAGTGSEPTLTDIKDQTGVADSLETATDTKSLFAVDGQDVTQIFTCTTVENIEKAPNYYISIIQSFSVGFNCTIPCRANGVCVGNNTCECNSGWTGDVCNVKISCYGMDSSSSSVCSGHGSCNSIDSCTCYSGWLSSNCSVTTCSGIRSDDASVCSGHGYCDKPNTCSCWSGYSGSDCQVVDTIPGNNITNNTSSNNGTTTNNSTDTNNGTTNSNNATDTNNTSNNGTNSNNGTDTNNGTTNSNNGTTNSNNGTTPNSNSTQCKENYFGSNCDKYCKAETTCTGNGNCNSNGDCICVSGITGNKCNQGWIGPLQFTDFGDGFKFKYFNPNVNERLRIVNCSEIFPSSIIDKLGLNPVCEWTNRESGEFKVNFGSNPTLRSGTSISINDNAFVTGSTPSYSSSSSLGVATNPISPNIIIKKKDSYGSDEDITFDASQSYSGDKNDLQYHWSCTPSIPIFESLRDRTNVSTVTISKEDAKLISSGSYTVTLRVVSELIGVEKSIIFAFNKKTIALPQIDIVGKSNVIINAQNLPFVIKKSISLPEGNDDFTVEWTQTSNTASVGYKLDEYQNLVITNLSREGVNQLHEFQLKVKRKNDENSYSTAVVSFKQVNSPQTLDISTSDISSESLVINIKNSDPDNNLVSSDANATIVEKRVWTCSKVENSQPCDSSVISLLNTFENQNTITLKSTDFSGMNDTDSIIIGLSIIKNNTKSISKKFTVNIPKANPPPTVNTKTSSGRSTDDDGTDLYRSGDKYSAHISPFIDGVETNNVNTIDRVWKFNGEDIPVKLLTHMKQIDLSTSNSIVLDTSNLPEGSINYLTVNVTNKHSGKSSNVEFKFGILKRPQCNCKVSLMEGNPFTQFVFSCPNCQNIIGSYTFEFGYLDPVTQIPVAVVHDSSKLGNYLPFVAKNGTSVTTYHKIIDSSSGSETETRSEVTVATSTVESSSSTQVNITQVLKIVNESTNVGNALKDGNTLQSSLDVALSSSAITSTVETKGVSQLLETEKQAVATIYQYYTVYIEKITSIYKESINTGSLTIPNNEFSSNLVSITNILNLMKIVKEPSSQDFSSIILWMEYLLKMKIELESKISAQQLLIQKLIENIYASSKQLEYYSKYIEIVKSLSDIVSRSQQVGEPSQQVNTGFTTVASNKDWLISLFPISENVVIKNYDQTSNLWIADNSTRVLVNFDANTKASSSLNGNNPITYYVQVVTPQVAVALSNNTITNSDSSTLISKVFTQVTIANNSTLTFTPQYEVVLPIDQGAKSNITGDKDIANMVVNCVVYSTQKGSCDQTKLTQTTVTCKCSETGLVGAYISKSSGTIDSKLSPGAIAGIVIGCIAFALIVLAIVLTVIGIVVKSKLAAKQVPLVGLADIVELQTDVSTL